MLTCVRDDGRTTWMVLRQGAFFRRHDLLHYAVESTLGLRESFYGLVAAGWNLDEFARPDVTSRLPREAIMTEFIVNFLAARWDDRTALSARDLSAHLNDACSKSDVAADAPFSCTQAQWRAIVAAAESLLAREAALGTDGVLELLF